MSMSYRTPSLSRDFSIFFTITTLVVLILSGWFGWRTYKTQADLIIQDLKSQTDRLEDTFQDILEYSEHLMTYIARQVVLFSDNGNNVEYVSDILSSYRVIEKDVLSWNSFSWVNSIHNVTVTSHGVMHPPYRSLAKRDYIPLTVSQPGKLHVGGPIYGILTHQWSIPLGYGVRNRDGRYIGALVTGLIVDSLENELESIINVSGITFHLLDRDYKVAAQSPGENHTLSSAIIETLQEQEKQQHMSGMLSTSLPLHHDNGFVYFRTFPNHPYKFVVSYDKELSDQRIWHTMMNYTYEFSSIGALIIILLYVFRQRVILPIVQLSNVAVQISEGKQGIEMPKNTSVEISNLAEQLRRVEHYTNELRETQSRLRKANDLLRSALGYMAHELKTPLNLIIGFSEMLLSEVYEKIGDRTKEYVRLVYDAGQHQQKLINTFLKTAEYEAGVIVLEKTPVHVMELLRKQIVMVSNLSAQMGVSVQLETPHVVLPPLLLDEIKIGQAFQNFITNGIKYNHRGGEVKIEVTLHRAVTQDVYLEVVFRDTGVGIESEKCDLVFQRFTRLHMEKDLSIEGSGLGLPFAKEVVESHGGDITMESTLGSGTVFKVRLPAILAECSEEMIAHTVMPLTH